MQKPLRVSAVLLVLAVAQDAAGQGPPANHRMQDEHAPTPFSASEIRRDCGTGAWRTFRLETQAAEGTQAMVQTTRFLRSGPEETELEIVALDASGQPQGTPQKMTATWKDLQSHASFPQANTVIERLPVELACGRFDTWLYSVVTEHGSEEKRFWFAATLAGPPICMEHWKDGQRVFRMTLLDYGVGENRAR